MSKKNESKIKITLKGLELSFSSIFEYAVYCGAPTKKYTADFLIQKSDNKNLKVLNDAITEVINAGVESRMIESVHSLASTCLSDGDEKADKYPSLEGCNILKSSTYLDIVASGPKNTRIEKNTEDTNKFFRGAEVNVTFVISLSTYNKDIRVWAEIRAIQATGKNLIKTSHPVSLLDDFEEVVTEVDEDAPF